ncbi:MAG: hypothetical protein GEU28_09575, partial [Dehalococcoidia bacterium]|nr:hypothetical protein [Dehalococcoidia bacterium]
MMAPGWWKKSVSRRNVLRGAAAGAITAALSREGLRGTSAGASQGPLAGKLDASRVSSTRTPIEHLVVLMQENHTFDNYFGRYPGVDGIPVGAAMPVDPSSERSAVVEPFRLGDNDVQMDDPDHSSTTHAKQLNLGQMNGFVSALNERDQDGRLAMGYYDETDLPY